VAQLQRVGPSGRGLGGRAGLVIGLIVGGLLVALIKPWGDGSGPTARSGESSGASFGPTGSQQSLGATPTAGTFGFDAHFRPGLFGDREPPPAWGLWPAGFLTTYGFASSVVPSESSSPSATPAPGGSPSASGPGGSPVAGRSLDPGIPPAWPARIEIVPGNHLLVVGFNTPVGYKIGDVTLAREASGLLQGVHTELIPSPWPNHFTIVALQRASTDGELVTWPPGVYRLSWTVQPGNVARSIEIAVAGVSDGQPGPTGSSLP
jgi:hypothetical protein